MSEESVEPKSENLSASGSEAESTKPAKKATRRGRPSKKATEADASDAPNSPGPVEVQPKAVDRKQSKLLFSSDDDAEQEKRERAAAEKAEKAEREAAVKKAREVEASAGALFPPKPKDLAVEKESTGDSPGAERSQKTERVDFPAPAARHSEAAPERPAPSHGQGGGHSPSHQGGQGHGQGGHHSHQGQGGFSKKDKFKKKKKNKGGGGHPGNQGQGGGGHSGPPPWKQPKGEKILRKETVRIEGVPVEWDRDLDLGNLLSDQVFEDLAAMAELAPPVEEATATIDFNELYALPLPQLWEAANACGIRRENLSSAPTRRTLLELILKRGETEGNAIVARGILEIIDDGYGLLTYPEDSYRLKPLNVYIPEIVLRTYGLQRGHDVKVQVLAPRDDETCLVPVRIQSVMGMEPEAIQNVVPFTELTPYYPTRRIILETDKAAAADFLSMRIVDLISPIGFGQRGLIVAPPRTGKTVLLQGIANSLVQVNPDVHLIILLIDERPEEVTDFKRHVKAEIISSTFDENAESHVHCAEMVIEKARRMVEAGQDVVILLDSITRLARAYNTLMPNSGKILSGGVEAGALQKPKRFFGSARNIEGAGSLTIMGTALIETGSKMDEVIFEEFKGTGNMELHLDRGLSDKRIFPALSMDRSGTRKEELLYHPDEMAKVYGLRRAMKGIPPIEAMEMLIQRVKKTKSNIEFLMTLNR